MRRLEKDRDRRVRDGQRPGPRHPALPEGRARGGPSAVGRLPLAEVRPPQQGPRGRGGASARRAVGGDRGNEYGTRGRDNHAMRQYSRGTSPKTHAPRPNRRRTRKSKSASVRRTNAAAPTRRRPKSSARNSGPKSSSFDPSGCSMRIKSPRHRANGKRTTLPTPGGTWIPPVRNFAAGNTATSARCSRRTSRRSGARRRLLRGLQSRRQAHRQRQFLRLADIAGRGNRRRNHDAQGLYGRCSASPSVPTASGSSAAALTGR